MLAALAWFFLVLGVILFAAFFPSAHIQGSQRELAYLGAGLWLFTGVVLATILFVARGVLPYLRRASARTADHAAKEPRIEPPAASLRATRSHPDV